jgi:hypothetical protein
VAAKWAIVAAVEPRFFPPWPFDAQANARIPSSTGGQEAPRFKSGASPEPAAVIKFVDHQNKAGKGKAQKGKKKGGKRSRPVRRRATT